MSKINFAEKIIARIFNRTVSLPGVIILAGICLNGCQPQNAEVERRETPANIQRKAATRVSAPDSNASEPALAADADGNLYYVFVEHYADKSADLFLQKFGADNALIGEKVRVNPEKGQAKTWFGDPPTVQVGKDAAVYVGWTAKPANAGKSGGNILYLSVSRDGAASFGAPVKVNDDTAPAAHGMHSLAVGDDNRIYAAWLDERNLKSAARLENYESENYERANAAEPEFQFIKAHHNSNQSNQTKIEKPAKNPDVEPNSEVFYAVSSDGGKTFGKNRKLASEVCPCCKTHLLAAPDGKVYVTWRQVLPGDYRHIAVSALTDGGNVFSEPVIVSDDRWQISACPISGAPLVMSADKTLTVAWFTAGSAGKQGIYSAESKDGGKTFAPRVLISENAVSGTPVLLNAGDFNQIVWTENGKITTKKLSSGSLPEVVSSEDFEGELPAAVIYKNRIYAGYVTKNAEQRGVWMSALQK